MLKLTEITRNIIFEHPKILVPGDALRPIRDRGRRQRPRRRGQPLLVLDAHPVYGGPGVAPPLCFHLVRVGLELLDAALISRYLWVFGDQTIIFMGYVARTV